MKYSPLLGCCALALWLGYSGFWLPGRTSVATSSPLPFEVPAYRPVDPRYLSLAIDCLSVGQIDPALTDLEHNQLDSLIEALGRTLRMHQEADFDEFLQLNRAGLDTVNSRRAKDVTALKRIMAADLNVSPEIVPDQWVEALRVFWQNLYIQPVLVEVNPLSSRVEVRYEHIDPAKGGIDLAVYHSTFDQVLERFALNINNAMALPHGRTVQEIASATASLTWVDVQVDVVLGQVHRYDCTLFLRFVWDGMGEEWFLARAVTNYPDHFDLGTSRSVLLF